MFRYAAFFAITAYILGWIAYLEVSPSMGNVWWRTNAEGHKEFTPWGIWATAAAPFKRGHGIFWTPAFWDINPWPLLGILGFLYFTRLFSCIPIELDILSHP